MSSNNAENILITAAMVTAELSKVKKIAKEMSIAVMNAKAISRRAGEAAPGFRAITDFIKAARFYQPLHDQFISF